MSDWRINNGDLEEDDVWSLMKSHDDHSSHSISKDYTDHSYSSSSSSSSSWHFPATPRMIPRANHNHTSSSSSACHDDAKIAHQSSAPVSIPDWSKIYGKNINGNKMMMMMNNGSSSSWVDVDHNHVNGRYGYNGGEYHYGVGDYGNNNNGNDDDDDDDDDNDDHGGVIPPHEWIAKRLARTQISSFSVCEGAGRTLKGRDLSKLRNAILTKTGFLE